MSDGLRLHCPSCGKLKSIQKENDYLKVKLKYHSLKHQENDEWYESSLPVYTCEECRLEFAIERVNK